MLVHLTDGSCKARRSRLRFDRVVPLTPPDLWREGFTLLEIATAIVIIGILATLSFPVYTSFRGRAEALQCASNMKGLGLGVQAYMSDHMTNEGGLWPQISPSSDDNASKDGSAPASENQSKLAERWITVLGQYGIAEKTWRCPSVEKQMKRLGQPAALEKKRIDYIPTHFSAEPGSADRWKKHPWFVERSALHGSGPNILFADGSISNLSELRNAAETTPKR